MDVLDRDGRIVDENTDRKRETTEGHHVDRLPHQIQHRDREQDRQRDRDHDGQRRAPAPEEHQDHQRGETCRERRLVQQAGDRRTHEHRLVEQDLHGQLAARFLGKPLERTRDRFLHEAIHLECRRITILDHRHQHRATSADVDHVRLRHVAVTNVRHVMEVDRLAVDGLDGNRSELVERSRARLDDDAVLDRAELRAAGRQDHVLLAERGLDVAR